VEKQSTKAALCLIVTNQNPGAETVPECSGQAFSLSDPKGTSIEVTISFADNFPASNKLTTEKKHNLDDFPINSKFV